MPSFGVRAQDLELNDSVLALVGANRSALEFSVGNYSIGFLAWFDDDGDRVVGLQVSSNRHT